jgi:hypothetical protein
MAGYDIVSHQMNSGRPSYACQGTVDENKRRKFERALNLTGWVGLDKVSGYES